jgi:hypothetical protein
VVSKIFFAESNNYSAPLSFFYTIDTGVTINRYACSLFDRPMSLFQNDLKLQPYNWVFYNIG